jgi:hypothetical protein
MSRSCHRRSSDARSGKAVSRESKSRIEWAPGQDHLWWPRGTMAQRLRRNVDPSSPTQKARRRAPRRAWRQCGRRGGVAAGGRRAWDPCEQSQLRGGPLPECCHGFGSSCPISGRRTMLARHQLGPTRRPQTGRSAAGATAKGGATVRCRLRCPPVSDGCSDILDRTEGNGLARLGQLGCSPTPCMSCP